MSTLVCICYYTHDAILLPERLSIMKKASIGCSIGILLMLVLCVGLNTLFADKPPQAIPWGATIITTRSFCASQSCHEWITYDIATDVTTLVTFYTKKGYQCYEHTNKFFTSVFSFDLPYWTCMHPRYQRGSVEIGFKVDTTTDRHRIRVIMYTFWDPWL